MSTNVSPQAAALRARPGPIRRQQQAQTAAAFPTMPKLPQAPTIPGEARAPGAASRQWLLAQLGPMATQAQARATQTKAGAQLALTGYGGWGFGKDDPNTPQREDLNLRFDPRAGPGEREKQAIRGEQVQANQRGLLYSSFANQNIASAVQRLSLEAQQIANQYAGNLNQVFSGYANQVSNVIGEWTSLYGQDAAWLAQNPPPPPAPTLTPVEQAKQAGTLRWTGKRPPNLQTLSREWGVPASQIKVYEAGPNYENRYLARLY